MVDLPDDDKDDDDGSGSQGSSPVSQKKAVYAMVVFGLFNLAIAGAHSLYPNRVDLIACCFAELSSVPLLSVIFTSFEFSGAGWKVKFEARDVVQALDRSYGDKTPILEPAQGAVEPARKISKAARNTLTARDLDLFNADIASSVIGNAADDVVFVRLRRDIEVELRRIAETYGLPPERSASRSLMALVSANIIGKNDASGLRTLIEAGNAQVHGASIPAAVAEFARTRGPEIVQSLRQVSYVPVYLLRQVASMAERTGHTTKIFQGPVDAGFDLKVDALPIDIRASAPTQSSVLAAISALLAVLMREELPYGLIVFASEPSTITAVSRADLGQKIGLAWLEEGRFVGDALANEIAPWLVGG